MDPDIMITNMGDCCYPFLKSYVLMETPFYQLDCCQFLFFKKILSHFESFIKVVVLDT